MALRLLLPLCAVAALLAAPPAASAGARPADDQQADELVDPGSSVTDEEDDAEHGEDAVEEDDESSADDPAEVDVVATLPDGTVAGSAHHRWTDEDEVPLGFTLNRAGRKAAKQGRVKLRLKAVVRYADGTTETIRRTVWIGKARPKTAAAKKKPVRR